MSRGKFELASFPYRISIELLAYRSTVEEGARFYPDMGVAAVSPESIRPPPDGGLVKYYESSDKGDRETESPIRGYVPTVGHRRKAHRYRA